MSCGVMLPNPCPVTPSCACPPGGASAGMNAQMVQGATYTFVFKVNATVIAGSLNGQDITGALAGDSNFGSPNGAVTTSKGSGLTGFLTSAQGIPTGAQVTFVYKGQGSTVQAAGVEMQNVLSSHFNTYSFAFEGAQVGGTAPAANACCSCGGSSASGWIWAVAALAVVVGIVLVFHEANS